MNNMNIIDSGLNRLTDATERTINFVAAIEERGGEFAYIAVGKVKWLGNQVSYIMFQTYSQEGFEKWNKALLANLKIISMLFQTNVFDPCMKVFASLKEVHYLWLVVGSLKQFIKKADVRIDPNNEAAGIRTVYSFQLPKMANERDYDFAKLFYSLGGFCNFYGYFSKLGYVSCEFFGKVSDQIGSIPVYGGKCVADISVIKSLSDKPRDPFFMAAASVELWRWVKATRSAYQGYYEARGSRDEVRITAALAQWNEVMSWPNKFKATISTCKIVLIPLSRAYSQEWWFITLSWVSDTSGYLRFLTMKYSDREKYYTPIQVEA